MGITQKDIARGLGISFITVNRAFNNSGYVSPQLRKKIFDYAKKYSYIPHRASQIMVRNKTRVIAVFTPTFPEYYWDDIRKGIDVAAAYIKSLNYEVRYFRLPDNDIKTFLRILKREIKHGLDAAAFINQIGFDIAKIVSEVDKAGLPYIFYNIDHPETNRICYIGADDIAGGRLAAGFIGHTLKNISRPKILVIGIKIKRENSSRYADINQLRVEGFVKVMKEKQPQANCMIEYVWDKQKTARSQIGKILKKYEGKVGAVYFVPAYNDLFIECLERYNYRRAIIVLHDTTEKTIQALKTGFLSAVVFQDPVLQGYTVIRTLEHILESKNRERRKDIEIVHTLLFRENLDYLCYHHLFMESTKEVNYE
jgi:LacI family transcriptional regulator